MIWQTWRQHRSAAIVAAVMLVEMLALMGVKQMATVTAPTDPAGASNTAWLGKALFTDFLLPFETAAIILTVAVIAAVMLTLRKRGGTKYQSPSSQVAVQARDRVRIVKMVSSTIPAPPAPESAP